MIPESPPPNPIFIQQNSKQITQVLFSSHEQILYSGNRDGDLVVYNYKYRRPVYSSNANKQPILTIVELNRNVFLTHTRNGCIFKWSGEDLGNSFKCVYQKEAYTFCQMSANVEKNLLFIASSEPSVIDCIEMNSYERVNQLRGLRDEESKRNRGMLMSLKLIDSSRLMAGYENGELALFDLNTFKEITSTMIFEGQPLMCFDYRLDKNVGICGSSESLLKQFTLNGDSINVTSSVELSNPGQNCISIRKSDSRLFATGGWDSRIRMYSLKKLKPLVVLDFHKDTINTIDFSSTDNLMACGSNDCIISFWNLYN